MFDSARFRLTAFYLAILLCFSLTLTIGVRMLAEHEFDRSNNAQRSEVHNLERDFFGVSPSFLLPPQPQNQFMTVQQDQNTLVRRHLNEDLILLNLCALVIGGFLSYWYAARTLKPIVDAHDAQKRFASDASHELRTPLANMQLENEVFLRQKSFSEAEARGLISSNLEEVQRLESLATNLLQLTQYEQASLQLLPIAAQKIVDDTLAHSAKALEARGALVQKNLASANVLGDRESLERLITIVVDNAIKYGPKDGKIFVTGKKLAGRYALSIRDQGSGIAAADLPHIFDRLYRGDKSRTGKTQGYGLGLALAKQIAAANQATITATNTKPHGAIFTIDLAAK
ncbi:MAG TPA: HAMP domain-containing sensor histidine kinase [Candidatus Saccharimonadales bacterium]|jgi:signal transduction histidine kinase